MKTLAKIIVLPLLLLSILLIGCKNNTKNVLNLSAYCNDTSYYLLYNGNSSIRCQTTDFSSNNKIFRQYSTIEITTNPEFSYGLTLYSIEFDIFTNQNFNNNIDLDITISNLNNAENYNAVQDVYYFRNTLSISKQTNHISLDINDTFINKSSIISIQFIDSCYTTNPSLQLSLNNFKMIGEHKSVNY